MLATICLVLIGVLLSAKLLFRRKPQPPKKPEKEKMQQSPPTQPETKPTKPKRVIKPQDSHLRKVSIATNNILFAENLEVNKAMAELLPALSERYRIFLITQVPAEDSPSFSKAKEVIKSLNCVPEHRSMFCTTAKGKESMVRQLGADLHVDSDPELC